MLGYATDTAEKWQLVMVTEWSSPSVFSKVVAETCSKDDSARETVLELKMLRKTPVVDIGSLVAPNEQP